MASQYNEEGKRCHVTEHLPSAPQGLYSEAYDIKCHYELTCFIS